MPRAKQVHLTSKEEIRNAILKSPEAMARMQFIKSDFWPALENTGDSIEQVVQFLSGFNTAMMQEFLSLMKDRQFKDLELDKKMDDPGSKYKPVVELFNDMTVFQVKEYIEGMKGEIELFRREEDMKRPLSSLKTKWLDEI